MATEHIERKLKLLPDLPGCYLMKDVNGHIIYVGKAKNLKNRVGHISKASRSESGLNWLRKFGILKRSSRQPIRKLSCWKLR